MNTCPNITSLPIMIDSDCNKSYERIKIVKFYPWTKKVFDEQDNYLGTGEIIDGILVITPTENKCSCGREAAKELHECDYQWEVNDDKEFRCNCCEFCQQQCHDDV